MSTRIRPPHGIAIPILIRMQAVRQLREARKRISGCKRALPRRIPPCPQIDLPHAVQFPREAERLGRTRRRHTPRIVLHTPQHRTRIIEGLAHAAQGVADVPGLLLTSGIVQECHPCKNVPFTYIATLHSS